MVKYHCKLCSYYTTNKHNYKKHITTQKHINREASDKKQTSNDNQQSSDVVVTQTTNPKQANNTPSPFNCEYCDQGFTKKTNLYRHKKKFCKMNPNNIVKEKEKIIKQKEADIIEKDEMIIEKNKIIAKNEAAIKKLMLEIKNREEQIIDYQNFIIGFLQDKVNTLPNLKT